MHTLCNQTQIVSKAHMLLQVTPNSNRMCNYTTKRRLLRTPDSNTLCIQTQIVTKAHMLLQVTAN